MFVATLLANDLGDRFMTSVTLYVVSLMFLARDVTHSEDLFLAGRLVALAIFWINLVLMAVATGVRLRSLRGLVALVAAATLTPVWDYGFEIRHDNVLLTALLLTWLLLRVWNWGRLSFFLVGVLSIAAELVAVKAFFYFTPLTICAVLGLAAPPRNDGARVPRLSAALAWCAGAAVAAIVFRIGYSAFGVWDLYARDVAGIFSLADGADRFLPIATLLRVVHQSPLLVAVAAIGCGQMAAGFRSDWPRIRRTLVPEAVLVLIALAALVMNPAPHPYNLLNFVPFLFLFGYRSLLLVLEKAHSPTLSAVFVVSLIVLATHLGLFAMTTKRHLAMTNERQRSLMVAAEALTDPDKDFVFDGIGMVPSRRSISREWLVHGLFVKKLRSSPASSVREMLRQTPASVLIQSYRTDWLDPEDHAFIRSRYIPLSDEFWLLGGTLERGGGTFEVVHPGRYIVMLSTQASQIGVEPTGPPIVVDGKAAIDGIVHLTEGPHSIECPPEAMATVVWIGPTLRELPRIGPGDHRRLFVNWY